jgi:hypothetical protein
LETKSGSLEGIKQSPLWHCSHHCCNIAFNKKWWKKNDEKKGKKAATFKARQPFWRQRAAVLETKSGRLEGIKQSALWDCNHHFYIVAFNKKWWKKKAKKRPPWRQGGRFGDKEWPPWSSHHYCIAATIFAMLPSTKNDDQKKCKKRPPLRQGGHFGDKERPPWRHKAVTIIGHHFFNVAFNKKWWKKKMQKAAAFKARQPFWRQSATVLKA